MAITLVNIIVAIIIPLSMPERGGRGAIFGILLLVIYGAI
jgi:hypothetical protein